MGEQHLPQSSPLPQPTTLHPHWTFPACLKPTPTPLHEATMGQCFRKQKTGQRTPNSRGKCSHVTYGGRRPSCPIHPFSHTRPPEFLPAIPPSKKTCFLPMPPLLFSRSKNSLQFYLMKDTFMNNQMILIKILLKDVKISYLPTTEVAPSLCPFSPWLSAGRAPGE